MPDVAENLAQQCRKGCSIQQVRACAPRVAAAVALALMLAACGSSPTASDLFKEYLESTNVVGDDFRGATRADRLAEFAAEGTPSEIENRLLFAYPKRNILVKHRDGQLELMPLYVVPTPGGGNLVSDGSRTYRNLDDFRRHNELSADDEILTARDLTVTSGDNEVIVVSGHTGRWNPWLVGIGIVVVVIVGTELLRIWLRRRDASRNRH